jgi:hypothetical protein
MTLKEIARQAAEKAQREITGPDMLDERNRYAVADAVALKVLHHVQGELHRHSQWSNSTDPVAKAHSQGYADAAGYIAGHMLAFPPSAPPQTLEPLKLDVYKGSFQSAPLAPAVEPKPTDIEALQIDKVMVVGHSMGGMLAGALRDAVSQDGRAHRDLLKETDDYWGVFSNRTADLVIRLRDALRAEATARQQAEQERDNLREANRIMLDRANRTEEAEAAQQQAEQERHRQYDQAVEATQRALLAEQERDDLKEEKRNEI